MKTATVITPRTHIKTCSLRVAKKLNVIYIDIDSENKKKNLLVALLGFLNQVNRPMKLFPIKAIIITIKSTIEQLYIS